MSLGHLINNQWHDGQGEAFESKNPATNAMVWHGCEAQPAEVEQAVAAARAAFPQWSQTPLAERMALLERFAAILSANKERLGMLIAEETGKPAWEAATEVGAMIGKVAVSRQAFDERTPNKENEQAGALFATRHKPHGVLAVFGPYNFPGHLPNGHIVPALLAGNTIVFKPSELTPKVAEQMMHYWLEADCPEGVINLVQGGRQTGQALANAQDVDGILFTGSYQTGRWLHENCAGAMGKLLALELGGNNPLLVFDVADIDGAVFHTIASAFITSGQRCTCARRLIIPEQGSDVFLQRLVELTQQLRVGRFDQKPEPYMGSVISSRVAEQLLQKQKALLEAGGESLLALTQLQENTGLVTPGIVDMTAVPNRSDEEIFGPLLQVIKVPDFAAALTEANNTSYGLAAALLSDDEALYQQFYRHSRAGIVNWNRATTGASSAAPFGGVGHSGNHRPSAFYAADYCAYPVASVEASRCELPDVTVPGLPFV